MGKTKNQREFERRLASLGFGPAANPNVQCDWGGVVADMPGLCGDIARFSLGAMLSPSPRFAVVCGLLTGATIYNRLIRDPRGNFAHLYFCGLAPAGAGKDPLVSLPQRLVEAGFKEAHVPKFKLFHPNSLTSESAFADLLSWTPAATVIVDEAAGLLEQIAAGSRTGSAVASVGNALKKLYSFNAGSRYTSAKKARVEGKTTRPIEVDQPCLSCALVSQTEVLPNALREIDLQDGLLARLVFAIDETRPTPNFSALTHEVEIPTDLAKRIGDVLAKTRTKQVGTTDIEYRQCDEQETVAVPYDEDAETAVASFAGECVNRLTRAEAEGDPTAPLWSRVNENAMRIALLLAAGRFDGDFYRASISRDDFHIAREIANAFCEEACAFLRSRVVDDRFEKLVQSLLRFIAKGAHGQRTKREIAIGTRIGKDRDMILQRLEADELITASTFRGKTRPSTIYAITADGRKRIGK